MFVDNSTQLKNYGIQLQNIGTEIQNFSNNCYQIPQNIINQIQNMAIQISNIGIQIFNLGIQQIDAINQNINMINQNMFMGMGNMNMPNFMNQNIFGMGMNEMQPLENNNINNSNDKSGKKLKNYIFQNDSGLYTNIIFKYDATIEELSKLYMNRVGLKYELFENEDIYFLINGYKASARDKKKKFSDYEPWFLPGCTIKVFKAKNLIL